MIVCLHVLTMRRRLSRDDGFRSAIGARLPVRIPDRFDYAIDGHPPCETRYIGKNVPAGKDDHEVELRNDDRPLTAKAASAEGHPALRAVRIQPPFVAVL